MGSHSQRPTSRLSVSGPDSAALPSRPAPSRSQPPRAGAEPEPACTEEPGAGGAGEGCAGSTDPRPRKAVWPPSPPTCLEPSGPACSGLSSCGPLGGKGAHVPHSAGWRGCPGSLRGERGCLGEGTGAGWCWILRLCSELPPRTPTSPGAENSHSALTPESPRWPPSSCGREGP